MPAKNQHVVDLSLEALRVPGSVELRFYVPIAAALLLHLGVQYREPRSRPFFALWMLTNAALTYFIHDAWRLSPSASAGIVWQMNVVWVATLFTSMAIYRLFFHRLRHFPGPVYLRLSKWVMVYPDLRGQRPYMFQRYHRKYGDVIRTGPRELSVCDPAALSAIYGATGAAARCTRGPWYDFTVESTRVGARNLQSTPTMSDHASRRKVWDAAFSMKAIKGYEENILDNVNLTMSQISKREAEGPVDLGRWCSWFGFDVMGELGFGRGFDMVKKGKTAHEIHLLEQGVILIMASGNVPYIMSLVKDFPNPIRLFEEWIVKTLKVRVKEGKTGCVDADVFSYLLGESKARGNPQTFDELSAEAGLLIVAGSDTSSNAMAVTLYYLVKHPEYYQQVRDEVAAAFGEGHMADDFDKLAKECPFINACINEALRLWPPVASGLQRNTPPEGLTLPDGTYIPGNTVVSTMTYAMQRDPRNFSDPDSFLPRRWIDKLKEGEVFNQKAFAAFGYGPTGCIGRNVAYHEMRAMIARFCQTFDAKFAPGFDADAFQEGIRDCFVMVKPPIPVVVKTRKAYASMVV
ncbi:cytochrome P450 [Acaromyces ingoldii]|uniref:Cytochrome P450 n=1 Tax=Acaromyces ingoldii TaxID=215250 RepID=A0A316YCB3_9BASI|nr:cytochrome P450 [Acaromyces ingoldii]PWN86534.1 cytochrome P450 [Acaromyces ingoldii]